jgi:hypothetical protein
MNVDGWARWLTGLGVSIAVLALAFGIWIQLVTDTGRGIGSFEETARLTYALYTLMPVGVGLAVAGLGRMLALVATARAEVTTGNPT